jgi:hypothetical protein
MDDVLVKSLQVGALQAVIEKHGNQPQEKPSAS